MLVAPKTTVGHSLLRECFGYNVVDEDKFACIGTGVANAIDAI